MARSTAQAVAGRPFGGARHLAAVERLLARSDAELVAATFSGEPAERFLHAHLAALRAGAALVEAHAAAAGSRSARRGRPRPVWELVATIAPELRRWTAVFAAAAPLRAAVENGRSEVGDERAEVALSAAEEFQDAVRELLGAAGEVGPGSVLRAS